MKTFTARWRVGSMLCILLTVSTHYLLASNETISRGEAWAKAAAIRNFEAIPPERKEEVANAILKWESESPEFRQIPLSVRLPHSLISLTEDPLDYHLVGMSPFKLNQRQLNWIPSIDLFYELMIVHHQMQYELGPDKCPPLPMILALLSHETYMRNIPGDGGLSTGMCQLYRPSAQFLTQQSKNKALFNKLIYFDENGNHHFRSQRSMLEFVYHFLVKEKGYSNVQQEKGLSSYNGGGEKARHYGKMVLKKTMFYEGLIVALKAQSPKIASKNLAEWSEKKLPDFIVGMNGFQAGKHDQTWQQFGLGEKEEEELEIFRYEVLQHFMEIREKIMQPDQVPFMLSQVTIKLESGLNDGFAASSLRDRGQDGHQTPAEGNYLVLPPNRTIFSIFRENTFRVMARENDFYFFYFDKGEKVEVGSESRMVEVLKNGHVLMNSAVAGDTVYIPRGLPLYQFDRSKLWSKK